MLLTSVLSMRTFLKGILFLADNGHFYTQNGNNTTSSKNKPGGFTWDRQHPHNLHHLMEKHQLLLNTRQFPSTTFPATRFWIISDQLVISMVNYKISQWESQNQVLSLGLKASKQILFPKHFIAGREKAAGTPRLCLSIQKSFSKKPKEQECEFSPR